MVDLDGPNLHSYPVQAGRASFVVCSHRRGRRGSLTDIRLQTAARMRFSYPSTLGRKPIGAALKLTAEPALDYPHGGRVEGDVERVKFSALRLDLD